MYILTPNSVIRKHGAGTQGWLLLWTSAWTAASGCVWGSRRFRGQTDWTDPAPHQLLVGSYPAALSTELIYSGSSSGSDESGPMSWLVKPLSLYSFIRTNSCVWNYNSSNVANNFEKWADFTAFSLQSCQHLQRYSRWAIHVTWLLAWRCRCFMLNDPWGWSMEAPTVGGQLLCYVNMWSLF